MEASSNGVSYGQIKAKMMLGDLSNKLDAAIGFGAEVSVYNADITAVELNTAQCMILALFHGLLMNDLAFCQVLQQLFTKVEQLKSPYLISWLRDDFQFNSLDVVKVLSKLAHLVQDQKLIVTNHILQIFVGLNTKYGILEICKVMKEMKTIIFLKCVSGPCTKSQQTDPIPVSSPPNPVLKLTVGPPNYYASVDVSSPPNPVSTLPVGPPPSYYASVAIKKDPNNDSCLDSGPTQQSHSSLASMSNVENRSRAKSRTCNHVSSPPNALSSLPNKFGPLSKACQHESVDIKKYPNNDSCLDSGPTQQSHSSLASTSNVENRSRAKSRTRNHNLPRDKSRTRENTGRNISEIKKDLNHDSWLDSGPTQQSHSSSTSKFNVENRSRAKSMTRNHNLPRDKSRTRENTGRNISEFKGTTLKHAESSPNIQEQLSKEAEMSPELALVHSYLSRSGPINPSELQFATRKDKKGEPCLFYQAARDGRLDVIKALITIGVPVDCKDDEGQTAAHYAAQNGNIDILEVLKIHGADLIIKANNGSTLLHVAALNNRFETCGWLIYHGVPIEAQAYKGRTALHRAAMWGHMETVRLLIGRGASIHTKDFDKNTAYDLAFTQGHFLVANMLRINS